MNTLKAKYLAYFFSLCFIASLGVNIYKNFNSSFHTKFLQKTSVSTPVSGESVSGKMDIAFEENENEKEFDSSVFDLFIPELFVCLFEQLNFAPSSTIDFVADSSPIYVRVHNFRI